MLRVNKVEKYYQSSGRQLQALRSTSFELHPGECLAVTGPSGAGKTTLLNIIGCMTRPSSGRVYIDDQEITALPEHFLVGVRRRKIGFIFQQFYLFPNLSVLDNLCLPLIPLGTSPAKRKRRAAELLERFGLKSRLSSCVAELSGGEQQRVVIARALIHDPPYILADEPTSNIDADNCRLVLESLVELKERGRSILVASHDPLVLESKLVDWVHKVRQVL
jgi:putative ABC transport system ATP-binding protein